VRSVIAAPMPILDPSLVLAEPRGPLLGGEPLLGLGLLAEEPSEEPDEPGGPCACSDPNGVGPRLFFQPVPEGKVVKNRVHLDVRVGTGLVGDERLATLEAECERLVALGASLVEVLRADGVYESCIVMRDVEGNEFCLD